MKRIPCLLLAGCTLILSGQDIAQAQYQGGSRRGMWGDPSQFFDSMAKGKDYISRDDLTSSRGQDMFDRMAERLGITDGKITRAQFMQSMQDRMKSYGSGSGGGFKGKEGKGADDAEIEAKFRRKDVNGDGLLNYDEMGNTLRAERDKWDTNKDGFIDLNEYKAYRQAVLSQRQAEAGKGPGNGSPGAVPGSEEEKEEPKPVVYRAGNLPKELPAWFKQMDTDNDGQISIYEWRTAGRPLKDFPKMDRNDDGYLTINEVLFYVKENPKEKDIQVAKTPPVASPGTPGSTAAATVPAAGSGDGPRGGPPSFGGRKGGKSGRKGSR